MAALPVEVYQRIVQFDPSGIWKRVFDKVIAELRCYNHFGWYAKDRARSRVAYACCVCDVPIIGEVTHHRHWKKTIEYTLKDDVRGIEWYYVCDDDEGPFLACRSCAAGNMELLRSAWLGLGMDGYDGYGYGYDGHDA